MRDISRWCRITRENCAIPSCQRETCAGVPGKLFIKFGKDLRHDGNHDDPGELPVVCRSPPTDTEETLFCRARLQDRANISAGIPLRLCLEVVAVGDACIGRERKDRR